MKFFDGSCVVGLVLGAIGLTISIPSLVDISVPLRRLPAVSAPRTMATTQFSPAISNVERCLPSCGQVAALPSQTLAVSQTALSGTLWMGNAPHRESDARTYLLDAATAARRGGLEAQSGETHSALWLNAPTSIGSTSPAKGIRAAPDEKKDSRVVLD